MDHNFFMKEAIFEAMKAFEINEVPVGCVIVYDNQIIGRGHNRRTIEKNPLKHAEIIAINEACAFMGDWRLEDCHIYVTVEPCPMCAGAILQARMKSLCFGAWNKKAGACGSVIDIIGMDTFNHKVEVEAGFMHDECAAFMSSFFAKLRAVGRAEIAGGTSIENLIIRLEEPKDYRTVEELTRTAFNTPDRIERSKIDCPIEHYMVHRLRKKDGVMNLNFVAEIDGRIVGHIIYSDAYILQPDGSKIDVLNFGPLSVHPDLQKSGIGSALMEHSISEAKKLGYGAILFFGHPEYYPRFGFVDAKKFNITTCDGKNFPAFMAMELKEDYLENISGKFIEADIYNDKLNREQAKEFDIMFR